MGDDDFKPDLPTAGTSILTGIPVQEQLVREEVEADGSLQPEEGDEIATEDGVTAAFEEDDTIEHVDVPNISISRPSVSSITGALDSEREKLEEGNPEGEGQQPVKGGEATQEEVPPTPPKEVTDLSDVTAPNNGGASTSSSPKLKRASRPESEMSQPTLESSDASRRSSITSATSTTVHSRSSLSSLNKGSAVFVISALEQIGSSKEAKGSKAGPKALREASSKALEMVRNASQSQSTSSQPHPGAELDPRVVFEPLRLACQTRSTSLIITSLDCLGKLVSYSFFAEDTPNVTTEDGEEALADLVTSTVCDAFYDGLDERAQLQIIKALLAVVLSTSVHVHQSSLLKAVRTVYNIFLMSKSAPTQGVAQGVLTQMVHHVFGRVPRRQSAPTPLKGMSSAPSREDLHSTPNKAVTSSSVPKSEESDDKEGGEEEANEEVPLGDEPDKTEQSSQTNELQEASEVPPATLGSRGRGENDGEAGRATEIERVTLRTLENRASFEGASERDTAASLMQQSSMSQGELFVKDAFLVLRALCKLSMKPLGAESERDLRSHAMRSKLLSLHLILIILKSHLSVFADSAVIIHSATTGEQTPFVQAVKQYLCLSLSRNAVSSVHQVFELSCEIFWLVLSGMRTKLKKEIEVLLNEIFLPILEMRTSTARQKSTLLNVLIRLCQDPQALVEIYLNYDCDRSALDNIYERLINVISKISQSVVAPGSASADKDAASSSSASSSSHSATTPSSSRKGPSIPPTLSTAYASETGSQDSQSSSTNQSTEVRLKRQSLECLCSVLKSLVIWSGKASNVLDAQGEGVMTNVASPRLSEDTRSKESISLDRHGLDPSVEMSSLGNGNNYDAASSRVTTPDPSSQDDPSRFESAKERKTMLLEGIKRFNFKPKRGIDFLVSQAFIPSRDPQDLARFLLYADGLNKAQIGEYLGEGDAENINIMHAFVDLMHFERMPFTDALRRFLQAFRLPGESQKIDRYMLKFAERYVAGNPNAFANADTAYVFAYSVIMLNTDAHNKQVKHRMTLSDFVKNNSGIDDGKSLAEEYLKSVYDEIQNNEIKMKDEVVVATPTSATPTSGIANALATVGRDLQREAYVLQSEGMANKTEALFRTMVRAQRRIHPHQRAAAEQFYSASHFEHVRPMFEVAWMAFLSGISGPLQESEDPEVVMLCLEAFKDAIRIVCMFGLELERNAFVTTLAKFTFLNNFGEMKSKNIEAIKTLLGIAQTEGNYLKGSWRELLTCVSQLERFQLISGGVDERSLPELGRRTGGASKTNPTSSSSSSRLTMPSEDVVQAGASSGVTVAADMVFSSTPHLSGTAIVDFIQSLCEVSWEEIISSGMTSENPRLFSLQKLVEISYYNMNRIRMEWSNIWTILGNHFNVVCTHSNGRVSSFGLDSLRQLSNRFLEKEELSHFKFQKDFLKPFEFTMRNNPSSEAKEMVLQCLQQMIASRIHNLRSGWRTLFGTLGAASKASERVASYAFELVRQLNTDHFGEILSAGSFADLTVCLTDFAKASHAQRLALQSVSMLRGIVPKMLSVPECPLDLDTDPGPAAVTPMIDDPMVRFWFPSLFSFYDIIMNGDDLEVRRVALDSLFEILKKYGTTFRLDFWDTVCQEVLFPIFAVLRSRSDVTKFSTQEDMSVWLSTTMIQALRNLIDLWTFYFQTLERLLPGLLDLLCACICQENDTLARIGTSCLQNLLENNVRKLSEQRWSQVVDTFVLLFRTTTASQLFDPALRSEQVAMSPSASRSSIPMAEAQTTGGEVQVQALPSPSDDSGAAAVATPALMTQSERRRIFKQIIVKCVLQLLLIETTNELLSKGLVYDLIPSKELLRLTGVLENSFKFSRKFNSDKELRTALWKVGFMRQLPNLLKQESSSASTLMNVLTRMHRDTRGRMKVAVGEKLIPLSQDILISYLPLDVETQARNITAWTPVVVEVLSGVCGLIEAAVQEEEDRQEEEEEEEEDGREDKRTHPITKHSQQNTMSKDKLIRMFYPLAVDLLGREGLSIDITVILREFFGRVGYANSIMTKESELERKKRIYEMREREKVERKAGDSNGLQSKSSRNESSAVDNNSNGHQSNGASSIGFGAIKSSTDNSLAPTPPIISDTVQSDPMDAVVN
ncbi:hypothetical protein CBS101457_001340 [Exobasidium rhododendri]|nr:hypothetical protein CBS101457_001340 [Exobasidium rhododendri]